MGQRRLWLGLGAAKWLRHEGQTLKTGRNYGGKTPKFMCRYSSSCTHMEQDSRKPTRKWQLEAKGLRRKCNSHAVLGTQRLVLKASRVEVGPFVNTSSFQLRSQGYSLTVEVKTERLKPR